MTDQPTPPAQMAVKPLLDAMAQIKNWSFDGWQASAFEGAAISTNGREAIATILNAVASGAIIPAPAPAEQEPVAWQYRYRPTGTDEWSDWADGKMPDFRGASYEAQERPLYAHPAPVPAVPEMAKQVYELQHGGCRAHLTAAWGAMDKAADTIEAQAAELALLRADRDQGAKDYCDLMEQRDALHVRVKKLEAALRRARAAINPTGD